MTLPPWHRPGQRRSSQVPFLQRVRLKAIIKLIRGHKSHKWKPVKDYSEETSLILGANRTTVRDGPFRNMQRLRAAKRPWEVLSALSEYQNALSRAYELLVRVPRISLLALPLYSTGPTKPLPYPQVAVCGPPDAGGLSSVGSVWRMNGSK